MEEINSIEAETNESWRMCKKWRLQKNSEEIKNLKGKYEIYGEVLKQNLSYFFVLIIFKNIFSYNNNVVDEEVEKQVRKWISK